MVTDYLDLDALLELVPDNVPLKKLWEDYRSQMETAPGSSHNHQAWYGGYRDHVVECLNIAHRLYASLSGLRVLPFSLADALIVLYLHDIEKPFKHNPEVVTPLEMTWDQYVRESYVTWENGLSLRERALMSSSPASRLDLKTIRRQFRSDVIQKYGIALTEVHHNALRYVEGIPDSEYKPGERIMGELAAFCHMCDICSARLWYDKGQDARV